MSELMLRPQIFYLLILNCDENKTSFPMFEKQRQLKTQLYPTVTPATLVSFIVLHQLRTQGCDGGYNSSPPK